jgi:hypothetical protein
VLVATRIGVTVSPPRVEDVECPSVGCDGHVEGLVAHLDWRKRAVGSGADQARNDLDCDAWAHPSRIVQAPISVSRLEQVGYLDRALRR